MYFEVGLKEKKKRVISVTCWQSTKSLILTVADWLIKDLTDCLANGAIPQTNPTAILHRVGVNAIITSNSLRGYR